MGEECAKAPWPTMEAGSGQCRAFQPVSSLDFILSRRAAEGGVRRKLKDSCKLTGELSVQGPPCSDRPQGEPSPPDFHPEQGSSNVFSFQNYFLRK